MQQEHLLGASWRNVNTCNRYFMTLPCKLQVLECSASRECILSLKKPTLQRHYLKDDTHLLLVTVQRPARILSPWKPATLYLLNQEKVAHELPPIVEIVAPRQDGLARLRGTHENWAPNGFFAYRYKSILIEYVIYLMPQSGLCSFSRPLSLRGCVCVRVCFS